MHATYLSGQFSYAAIGAFFDSENEREWEMGDLTPSHLSNSHNTERLFALINLPVNLIINTFTH